MGLSFAGLFWWGIRRGHMKIPFTPEGARRATIRFGIGNIAYLAAIGIAFLSPTASLIVSGLVAIYYIFEQTPAGSHRDPDCGHRIRDRWPGDRWPGDRWPGQR